MANVKRRLNAPKSAPKNQSNKNLPAGRSKRLRSAAIDLDSTDDKGTSGTDNGVVKKRAANELILSPDQKVKYLLQHGRTLKKKVNVRKTWQNEHLQNKHKYNTKTKTGKIKKKVIIKPTPDLPGLVKDDKGLLGGVPNRYYLKIMDEIIMSEFGLQTTPNKSAKTVSTSTSTSTSTRNGVNNNNNSDITDQNHEITDGNNKSTAKNNKLLVKNKKTASKDVLQVPENITLAKDQSKNNKKQTELVNFADEPKPLSPPPLRNGRQKKIPKYGKTPKTKQITLANGVVLTLPLYECDYCQKTFNRKHSLVRHIYLHLGRKPHACPVCPKKFRILKNMKVHVDRDHCIQHVDESTQTYLCNICDKAFLSEENLNLHLTSHAKGENSFKCIYCDQKFSYQLLLVQHEKKHLVEGKYQCTLCDAQYVSRERLYVHVKSHLQLADYICQFCGKEFLRANSLKRHIQSMHGGRTVQCPICNKHLKGHLSEHMRTHDNKRPHKCPDCGKRFAQSTQMKVHSRKHTGSRPYGCKICDRTFSHSNALMLHIRRHTGEKPFVCAECPMTFSQLPHMKSHMFKIHSKSNPYKCLKCNNYFKLKKDLVVHKNTCDDSDIGVNLYGEERPCDEDSVNDEAVAVKSTMTLSRMRYLLALLLTMIATKEKLKYLGFNKRLIDDLLVESLEAMDQIPCVDETLSPLVRLRTNIEKLLKGTVPAKQMSKFKKQNKSTEELLELLTSEKVIVGK